MKAGAVDFLEACGGAGPAGGGFQGDRVRTAARDSRANAALAWRITTLTPREREVLALVVAGRLNKQIAHALGASIKTIKVHRARVMAKMGVRTVADLVRATELAGSRAPAEPSSPGT
jgi:FixJ family two-component response regulator